MDELAYQTLYTDTSTDQRSRETKAIHVPARGSAPRPVASWCALLAGIPTTSLLCGLICVRPSRHRPSERRCITRAIYCVITKTKGLSAREKNKVGIISFSVPAQRNRTRGAAIRMTVCSMARSLPGIGVTRSDSLVNSSSTPDTPPQKPPTPSVQPPAKPSLLPAEHPYKPRMRGVVCKVFGLP